VLRVAGGFWQFFGLDPSERASSPAFQSPPAVVPEAPPSPEGLPEPGPWRGEETHEGHRFIDLGRGHITPRPQARRAVRYLAPDPTGRLPLERMMACIQAGDCLFIDLTGLVHMQAHQDALRSELRRLGQTTGVGAWALDSDDLLFLVPGAEVMMDTSKHLLGRPMRALLPSS